VHLSSAGWTSPQAVKYVFKRESSKKNYGEEDLGVYYVPSWQTPIDVRVDEDQSGATYGLVCSELVESEWPERSFPSRLVERLGIRNLVIAAQECGRVPVASRNIEVLAPRLHDFVTNELAPLMAPILDMATANGSISDDPSEDVVSFVARYGPSSPRPRRLRHDDRVLWGQTFAHILERASSEIFELYAVHARVRRCRFCHSVFVPRRDEHVCRWNLWTLPMRVGDPALRLCSEQRNAEAQKSSEPASERTEYNRERRRLWAQYDRERKAAIKAGEDPAKSARVVKAGKTLSDLIQHRGPKRGRPTREDTLDVHDDYG
jgi:hypothetical protein